MPADGELLPTVPMRDGDAGEPPEEGATYGRFVSLGVIGRGGMGVVLRARDPELDREVAIKLLGASPWSMDPTSTQRLQREAQAMAKLSHPNVVTVYEMGQIGAARFIAMELVEGTTLRRWLVQPRPWREVVEAFIAAGRGLAAAHVAGLVHRDFKPENVLIGKDGRPRVSDFGLVTYGVAIGDAEAGDASPVTPLTVRGAAMGTPAYMPAEQWRGDEVDARGDQFAFCVALWEALYGERPFAGAITAELRERILAGDLRPPARDRKVPRRIEAALRRGLSRERADRWPSMTPLLAELDRPRRRLWPWIAGTTVGLAAAATAIVIATRPAADPCPDPTARMAGVWDVGVRDRVAAAFGKANPAVAGETLQRITPALDTYANQWRAATRSACQATHVDGTQSAALLDQRMLCLERRRTELAALTSALATATERDRVATAIDRVGGLGDLDGCADKEMLLAIGAPIDPAQREQVDALEAELTASRQMEYDGRPPDRQARAQRALSTARQLGRLPQLLHALEEVEDAADVNDDDDLREATLHELAQKAAEAHDDRLAAKAWISLIRLLARAHRFDESKALESAAEVAVTRAGAPAKLRFELTAAMATRRMYASELADSIDLMGKAVDLATTDAQHATAQLALAQVMFMKDGPAKAVPIAEQALASVEKAYGPNHPRTADGLYLLAQFLIEADQLDRADQLAQRALAIREAAFGPDHHDVGTLLHLLGNIANQRDDTKGARAWYEKAIANFDSRGESDEAGLTRGMLASIVTDEDGFAAGRPIFERALADLKQVGKGQRQYLSTELNYANRLTENGLCDEALPLLAHATEALRESPQRMPYVLVPSSTCDLAAHRTGEAIAKLEQGHKICVEGGCPPPLVLEMDWRLGRILVETGKDRARGQKLIDGALADAGEYDKELIAQITAWRLKHPK